MSRNAPPAVALAALRAALCSTLTCGPTAALAQPPKVVVVTVPGAAPEAQSIVQTTSQLGCVAADPTNSATYTDGEGSIPQ